MVGDMNPVPGVCPVAVYGQRLALQGVRHKEWDHLLRILVRPVVVRAAGDDEGDAVGYPVGVGEPVGTGLACGVRALGHQRAVLAGGLVTRLSVDLVGRDAQEPPAAHLAEDLEQDVRP